MQTYSHFIITAGLKRVAARRRWLPVRGRAFLLGSVLPDLPLLLLTLWYFADIRWLRPEMADAQLFGAWYDDLFFNNLLWIVSHNLFHAPLIILSLGLIGWRGWKQGRGWGLALLWFAMGCGLHSLIDIFTHHHDGPLLLFPFDLSLRFQSPVSYWDPRHYGRLFAPLEHLLDVVLLLWLWRSRSTAESGQVA
ncbi:MAG: DUF4184 family protein [Anaerolineales bacterium]|nr:DUF4184 family protein [Anaerolineales bacterium]MCB9126779.1 DUF4184 family protein [Ardenticatenales bacterium]